MGGIELVGDTLTVDRAPNRLDELAIEFSTMLTALDIDHMFVSGYVAILAGRSRSMASYISSGMRAVTRF